MPGKAAPCGPQPRLHELMFEVPFRSIANNDIMRDCATPTDPKSTSNPNVRGRRTERRERRERYHHCPATWSMTCCGVPPLRYLLLLRPPSTARRSTAIGHSPRLT